MLRIALIASLVTGAFVLGSLDNAHSSQIGGPIKLDIKNEPILSFTVSGGTLAGTVNTQLTVYNSGLATISRYNENYLGQGPLPLVDKDVDVASIDAKSIRGLQRSLLAAGAFSLPDSQPLFFDIPLSTLTVLGGATDAQSHTYSYYGAIGAYEAPAKVISTFVDAHFPGF